MGETFLFTFNSKKSKIKVFLPTMNNTSFIYCNLSHGIGLGDEPYHGLYIHSNLRKGTTTRCQTFDNDPLTVQGDFIISNIEIWGMNM